MIRLILGSQSPRRREILSHYSIPFEQATSQFAEEAVAFHGDPKQYVITLSKGKADALAHRFPNEAILTADSVVYLDNKIYNKPLDEKEAYQMLSELSGKWHSVYTGVTLRHGNKEYHQVEETQVEFNSLSEAQINSYIETRQWSDKAGGYGIQTSGGLIVRQITGCFYNVMGLPINTVRDLLMHIGIDLWKYLK
jgi:septum formation protein